MQQLKSGKAAAAANGPAARLECSQQAHRAHVSTAGMDLHVTGNTEHRRAPTRTAATASSCSCLWLDRMESPLVQIHAEGGRCSRCPQALSLPSSWPRTCKPPRPRSHCSRCPDRTDCAGQGTPDNTLTGQLPTHDSPLLWPYPCISPLLFVKVTKPLSRPTSGSSS